MICITGASSGIGAAAAKAYSNAGYSLVLGARRIEKIRELDLPGTHHVVTLDVTSKDSCERFYQSAKEFGNISTLVNNAGLALGTDHVSNGREEDWRIMLNTNVLGVLSLTKLFLNDFIQKKSGDIVMLSSIAAHESYAGGSVYCATKHAIKSISKSLRLETLGKGVRIMTIDPGLVETEFSNVRFRGDSRAADSVYKGMTPLTPQDIAACIVFATSRPRHVNIDQMIVMPTEQGGVHNVHRSE